MLTSAVGAGMGVGAATATKTTTLIVEYEAGLLWLPRGVGREISAGSGRWVGLSLPQAHEVAVCRSTRGPSLWAGSIEVGSCSHRQSRLEKLAAKLRVVPQPCASLEGSALQCLVGEQARRKVRVERSEDRSVHAPCLEPALEVSNGRHAASIYFSAIPFTPSGLREISVQQVSKVYILTLPVSLSGIGGRLPVRRLWVYG